MHPEIVAGEALASMTVTTGIITHMVTRGLMLPTEAAVLIALASASMDGLQADGILSGEAVAHAKSRLQTFAHSISLPRIDGLIPDQPG